MNQPADVIHEALITASQAAGLPTSPYHYLSIDYPSHMNTHTEASWIDHFFVYSGDHKINIEGSNSPEEISSQLVPVVEILKSFQRD